MTTLTSDATSDATATESADPTDPTNIAGLTQAIISPRTSCYTEFVRNVTITLDEETARWVRVEAARHDTSVSRWVGQLLDERRRSTLKYERARHAYLTRGGVALKRPGATLPSRDELHER